MKKSNNSLIYSNALVGGHYFRTNQNNFLISARTAIHQDLIGLDDLDSVEDKLPDTVFLSDLTIKEKVSCQDLEFIFLASLFLGMDFSNGKPTSRLFDFSKKEVIRKFRVVVEEGSEDIVWGQLGPSLLGANKGFLKNTCNLNKNLWTMLNSEAQFFNLKNNEGVEFKIEDFVEVLYWSDNGSIELDGVLVKKDDNIGNFTVVVSESDDVLTSYIDFENEELIPKWDIPQSLKPFSFSDSSIIPLGTSSPFSIEAPPTSYWLKLGARDNYLIDCGFFTDIVYEKNGGSIDSLKGIILTHCHGDHFNPIPFLYRSRPIELWTTIENYKLAQKITCAKASITASEFQKRFIFKQVEAMYPGKAVPRYQFGHLEIEFHYSIHPIPTIGLTIYKEQEKLVVFSSDMVDLDFMESTLHKNKIIPDERFLMFLERFSQDGHENTIFLLDCGGDGFIHGKPGGYSKFFHDTTKVVECHRGSREEGEEVFMQLAQPLNLFKISDYSSDVRYTSMLAQMLVDMGIDYIVDLVAILKESTEVVEFCANQPIILEDSKISDNFYLIDYGVCTSSTGLVFEAGQWFGEECLTDQDEYTISYFSKSPVRLIKIKGKEFKKRIESLGEISIKILDDLKQKSFFRKALASAKLFCDMKLPVTTIDNIVFDISLEKFQTGDLVYQKGQLDDGHMYIIKSGSLVVEIGKGNEVVLKANDIVGESVASGQGSLRNANVVSKGRVDLIKISRETFCLLLEDSKVYQRIKNINSNRAA
jgi:CRP-like cAMP-binding protein